MRFEGKNPNDGFVLKLGLQLGIISYAENIKVPIVRNTYCSSFLMR